jgi:hypothetical protein
MFQKLYRHLEEINKNVRQEETTAAVDRLGDKLSEQLESANTAILYQNKLLLSQQETLVKANAPGKRGVTRVLPIVNLFLSSIGIVVLLVLSFTTYRLAQTTARVTGNVAQAPVAVAPLERDNAVSKESATRAAAQQEHLARLDSLVTQQAETIKELKTLNSVALFALKNIRNHFLLADSAMKANAPRRDSLAFVR